MSEIQDVLTKATKTKEGKDRQVFLVKLHDDVQKLSADDWDALPTDAQDWVNNAATAIKAKEPVPEMPDVTTGDDDSASDDNAGGDDAADNTEKDETDMATKKGATKKGSGATAKKPDKKPAGAAKADKPAKGAAVKKPAGAQTTLKNLLIKDMTTSAADLMAALEKKGIKVSPLTVSTIRSDFRHSVRCLQEADALKRKLITE